MSTDRQQPTARELTAANVGDRIDVHTQLRPTLRQPGAPRLVDLHGTITAVRKVGATVHVTVDSGAAAYLPGWIWVGITRKPGRAPMVVAPRRATTAPDARPTSTPRTYISDVEPAASGFPAGSEISLTVDDLDSRYLGHRIRCGSSAGTLEAIAPSRFTNMADLTINGRVHTVGGDRDIEVTILARPEVYRATA